MRRGDILVILLLDSRLEDELLNFYIYFMEKCKYNFMNCKRYLKYNLEFEKRIWCWVIGKCLVFIKFFLGGNLSKNSRL